MDTKTTKKINNSLKIEENCRTLSLILGQNFMWNLNKMFKFSNH